MTKAYDNSLLARNISISGTNTIVSGLLTSSSGNFINSLRVNSVDVSISGHNHIVEDIIGLQTALDGKQTSGSYADSSHTHTASNITDFNTSVSGLLPVTSIVAGSGISVSSTAGAHTINARVYSVTIGDGSRTSYTVTHNLSVSNDVHVSVRDTGTNYYVYPDIKYVNSNSVIIEFASAPTSNQYRVSIIGF